MKDPQEQTTVRLDTLVRVSEKGKANRICPKHPDRIGRIVNIDRDGMVLVRWNGLKTAFRYHPSFVAEIVMDKTHA